MNSTLNRKREDSRRRSALRLGGVLFLLLATYSCQTMITVPDDFVEGKNVPVFVNSLDVVTFAVEANAFSYDKIEPIQFRTDSLVLTLAVSNFGAGTGQITVSGILDTLLYTENLAGNQVDVLTDMKGCIPKTVAIRMNNYTGSVSFVLSKRK